MNVQANQKNTHEWDRVSETKTSSNNQPNDWHRSLIIAHLNMNGWNVTTLAAAHGIGKTTLASVFDKSYPKCEKIISDAIGVPIETIWAKRTAKRNFKPKLRKC